MTERTKRRETIDELMDLDIFAEARRSQSPESVDVDPDTSELCRTILVAADVIKRTIIAVHRDRLGSDEYDP